MPASAIRSPLNVFRRILHACLFQTSRPEASLVLCYAAGLVATRSLGAANGDAPAFSLAAAAVAGLAIRYGRGLRASDALRLGVVGLVFAAVAGLSATEGGVAVGLDLISIFLAERLFARLRTAGFVTSQTRVTAAAWMVAALIGAVQSVGLLVGAAAGVSFADVAAVFVTTGLGAALVVGLTLAFDRADRRFAAASEEPARPGYEAPLVWGLLAAFAIAAIVDGRQEIALAASVALMWSAVRLGLFPTALAAFLFVSTFVAFGAGDGWAALVGADPDEAALLRGLALALLTLPSLMVASATHDDRAARQELAFRAFHDGLTTLANRARFLDVLSGATDAARARGRRFALFLVDLDHFKAVNDSFGHASGDALLVEVSRRLRETVRATDIVARLGGDEFAVIAPVPSADDAARLAGRLVGAVDQAFVHNGLELRPSITVGVALAPDQSVDAERLTALADLALYEAKAAGRNCWRICSDAAAHAAAADWSADEDEPRLQIVYLD